MVRAYSGWQPMGTGCSMESIDAYPGLPGQITGDCAIGNGVGRMSNRDADARYEHLLQGVPFVTQQLMLQVHTSIPGIVTAYDAATRRARVQPAVHMMLSPVGDPYAPFAACEPMEKPIILDVPVIFPSAGGYTVHFPLLPDDPVLLLFSERDIDNFKQTLESGQPLSGDIMEVKHAVCIPGFVPPTVTLAGDGLVLQSNDGETYVHLNDNPRTIDAQLDGATHIRMDPNAIGITAVSVTVTGDLTVTGTSTLTGNVLPGANVDGIDVGTHTHSDGTLRIGTDSVTGDTGAPS